MSSVLKGNFQPKNPVQVAEAKVDDSVESRFEREALKRLGGSIAFVAKKKVMWDAEPPKKGAAAKAASDSAAAADAVTISTDGATDGSKEGDPA